MNSSFFLSLSLFLFLLVPTDGAARFAMSGGADLLCRELPTSGDPLGSDCMCKGTDLQLQNGTCRRHTWGVLSVCIGQTVGSNCGQSSGNSGESGSVVVPCTLQDGVVVNLYNAETDELLSPGDFWVSYAFHTLYDSCRVVYWFTELKQGDARLVIDNWIEDQYETEKTPEELSAISRSASFVVTGEEISYYHALEWFDHRPGKRVQQVDNFYCPDSLTYRIRAVNETTEASIVIEELDVRSNENRVWTSGGLPLAAVRWDPPSGWTGQTAYIDVQIEVEGPGLFNPARSDEVTGPLSVQLSEPYYSGYYEPFNQNFPPGGSVE